MIEFVSGFSSIFPLLHLGGRYGVLVITLNCVSASQ